MSRWPVAFAFALVLAGCITTQAAACTAEQVDLSSDSDWGPAAGTSYVDLHVRLVGSSACLLPASPAVQLIDAAGVKVASGPSRQSRQVTLSERLDFRLGWGSWCGPSPSGPLTVRLSLGSGIVSTTLPDGFHTGCMGAPTNLFVDVIDDS